MKEKQLLEKLRSDPENGMSALIEGYSGLVLSVVRARLYRGAFSEADIEACAADSFSEFYLSLDRFDPSKCTLKGWLCAIARNNSIDLLRKRQREEGFVPLDAEEAPEPACELSLEGEFIKAEEKRAVARAVLSLGSPDREIIMRKYYLED